MADEGNWWDNDEEEDAPAVNDKKTVDEEEESEPVVDKKVEEEANEKEEEEDNEEQDKDDETKSKTKREAPPVEKSEALKIIEAKQRKHEEEEMELLRQMEEQRRIQREKEDEELRRLKEKQAQRKREREEEERRLEEQKQILEEQRRHEEEARRQKAEDDKRKKLEEAERKKAAAQAAMSGGRNFVIENKSEGQSTIDKFMNISKAKTEMSLNTGELEVLKQRTINDRIKPLSIEDLDVAALRTKAEELWKTIIQLETARYDLSERLNRQEYDLKELNERQRQISHKRHLAQGLDPTESGNSRYPPKVQLVSKYERRTDRRTFSEKKGLFEQDRKGAVQVERVKPTAKKVRSNWVKEKGAESNQTKEEREPEDGQTDKESPSTVTDTPLAKIEEQENMEEESPSAPAEDVDEEEGESLW